MPYGWTAFATAGCEERRAPTSSNAASTTTPHNRISPATLEPELAAANAFTFGDTKLPMLPILFKRIVRSVEESGVTGQRKLLNN
ncbi:hypothetical protein AWB65_05611 [Caballeronia humi]|uniref:Uncharacterized protein n=1 Tax=Caballeronia humi TaxID=326474 RepID=A0A158IZ08_9BURK|nr:hypothetical protein AWB65_05611 [Caballeronia humi]